MPGEEGWLGVSVNWDPTPCQNAPASWREQTSWTGGGGWPADTYLATNF